MIDRRHIIGALRSKFGTVKPILSAVGGVGAAAALSQLASILVAPLLSRLYPPEAFGQFGALLSFANIVSVLVLAGMNDAILAAHDDDAASTLLGAALKLLLALLVPAWLLSAAAIGMGWAGLSGLPTAASAVVTTLVAVLVLLSLLQAQLGRQLRFKPLALSYVTLGWSRAALQVAIGLATARYWGLAAGELFGRLLANAVMTRGLGGHVATAWRIPLRDCMRSGWQYRRFPINRTPSMLISAIAVGAPVLMIADLYGAASAGQFSLMMTLLLAPLALLQRAAGDVFIGHFGQRYRSDRRQAARLALVFAAALGILAVGSAILCWFAAAPFFRLFLGELWAPAGIMAALCAPWIGAMILVLPLSQILNVVHRPELKLVFDIVFAAMLGALYWWSNQTSPSPLEFVAWLSGLATACYLLFVPLIWIALRRPGAMLTPQGADAISE